MRVVSIEREPFHEILYLNAAPGGGSEIVTLPVVRGTVRGLPDSLDALLVTSDLQGVVSSAADGGASCLLGEVLAEELALLADDEAIPATEDTGVLLAGDLYSAPDGAKLGASGDVRPVWRAFAERFRWVAGVAGNHDFFGDGPREREQFFRHTAGAHLLDGDLVQRDGLRIAGVSGITGNPRKPNRRDPPDFLRMIAALLHARPDILVLHEGPDGGSGRGNPDVHDLVSRRPDLLVVCGHSHWHEPLADLRGGSQALNVDARAVLLHR